MKIWILVAIAVALLVWGMTREPFEPTQSIKAPPYDDAEMARLWTMLSKADQDTFTRLARQTDPKASPGDKLMLNALAMPVSSFYMNVYKSATTPITEAQIQTHIERGAPPGEIRGVFSRLLTAYFINQSGVGGSMSSGYADSLKELGQDPGYLGTNPSTTAGTTAGGTTGGSSVTSAAPNSGSTSNRRVFGPVYTSKGTPLPGSSNGSDTSKTNQYPELLGGGLPDTSVRSAEGISNPSQSWLLSQSGALPSTASLGSDTNSMYLPTSRVPGDQDLIPDPYRLSRNYSTASYSSKTEPVPFLTDFSAFLK